MNTKKNDFIKIINENQQIISKICYSYTNNLDDKLDLQQEILIQLWKAYPKFKQNSKISTWIYRIALNTSISNLRKTKNTPQNVELSEACYQIPDFEEDKNLNKNITKLYSLIYQLNDLEKAIMLLYLEKQPYSEIANIVGISQTNVASKISRIKSKLKAKFNEKPKN